MAIAGYLNQIGIYCFQRNVWGAKMEFNEKLQELRKREGMTQEELASKLYVSRTAISKWESGRGYPNIESLKAISKLFGVTVDELLSSDEILSMAEEDGKQKTRGLQIFIVGLLDVCAALLLFLPFSHKRKGILLSRSRFYLSPRCMTI